MNAIRSNVGKLTALHMLQNAIFGIPIIVLFAQRNGVPLEQFLLLQSAFSILLFATEIPSGYLSDRWGRKRTLVTAAFFWMAGVSVYAVGTGIWHFLAAEMLLAVAVSCNSGTKEAMLFDSLAEEGRTDESRRLTRRQFTLRLTAEALAGILGGIVAFWSLRAAIALTVLPATIAFLIALTLREPKRKTLEETQHLKVLWGVCRDTMLRCPPLRAVIILYVLLASMTYCLFWLSQSYQEMVGLPLTLFGFAHGAMLLSCAAISHATERIEQRVDDRPLLMAVGVIIVGSYLLLGVTTSLWGMVFLFLGRSMFGPVEPLTTDLINHMTRSEVRATVLSIRAFFLRIVAAVLLPILGYAADVFTLSQTLLITGVTGSVILLVTFAGLRRVWAQLPR